MLICVDILACATTGGSPRFAFKFRDGFSIKDRLRCEDGNVFQPFPAPLNSMLIVVLLVIGCDTSVMESIMNIAELRHWKLHEMANESISVISLAKRALQIELSLQSSRKLIREKIDNHSVLTSSISESWIMTNVYACAASVYLHATVSRSCPKVPEIQKGVEDTMVAIKMLPRAKLVRKLLWPICMAACLAAGHQREYFENLERALIEDLGTSQNIVRALSVGRECERLRRCATSSRRAADWIDAMSSLEDHVALLF
jgi:hypothetical protein